MIEITDVEPDENESSIYLKALIQDISNSPGVTNVNAQSERIYFDSDLSENALKDALRPFFIRDVDNVRFGHLAAA